MAFGQWGQSKKRADPGEKSRPTDPSSRPPPFSILHWQRAWNRLALNRHNRQFCDTFEAGKLYFKWIVTCTFLRSVIFPYNSLYSSAVAYTTYFEPRTVVVMQHPYYPSLIAGVDFKMADDWLRKQHYDFFELPLYCSVFFAGLFHTYFWGKITWLPK